MSELWTSEFKRPTRWIAVKIGKGIALAVLAFANYNYGISGSLKRESVHLINLVQMRYPLRHRSSLMG